MDLESTEAAALDSSYVSVAINNVLFFFSQRGSEIEVVYVRLVQALYQRWPTLLDGRISLCLDGPPGFLTDSRHCPDDERFDSAAAQGERRGEKVLRHRRSPREASMWSAPRSGSSSPFVPPVQGGFSSSAASLFTPWHSVVCRGSLSSAATQPPPADSEEHHFMLFCSWSRRRRRVRRWHGGGSRWCWLSAGETKGSGRVADGVRSHVRHVCLPVESLHHAAGSGFFQVWKRN